MNWVISCANNLSRTKAKRVRQSTPDERPKLVMEGKGASSSCSWQRDWPGFREAAWSSPNEDKHKAPSSTLPRPLSLQDETTRIPLFGRQNSLGCGDASITRSGCQSLSGRDYVHCCIRLSKFIRTGLRALLHPVVKVHKTRTLGARQSGGASPAW